MKRMRKSLSRVLLFATSWTIQSTRILQARILGWVAFPFSPGSSQPRAGTQVSRIVGGCWFFTSWATREAPWRECSLSNRPHSAPGGPFSHRSYSGPDFGALCLRPLFGLGSLPPRAVLRSVLLAPRTTTISPLAQPSPSRRWPGRSPAGGFPHLRAHLAQVWGSASSAQHGAGRLRCAHALSAHFPPPPHPGQFPFRSLVLLSSVYPPVFLTFLSHNFLFYCSVCIVKTLILYNI